MQSCELTRDELQTNEEDEQFLVVVSKLPSLGAMAQEDSLTKPRTHHDQLMEFSKMRMPAASHRSTSQLVMSKSTTLGDRHIAGITEFRKRALDL